MRGSPKGRGNWNEGGGENRTKERGTKKRGGTQSFFGKTASLTTTLSWRLCTDPFPLPGEKARIRG